MQVPFCDLKRIYHLSKDEIDQAVTSALESGWYILGEINKDFELQMTRSLVGDLSDRSTDRFVNCNSGTDALILALRAVGVGQGDEVVTVSHTAIPTIVAIRAVGAIPRFVDIHPDTWVMDPASIEPALSDRTKAVILVHLYGNMVDVEAVKKILLKSKRPDITIIEDVAQAQGATFNGRQAGTMGHFGAFSFYPTKNIGALGDGGGVYCETPERVSQLRSLRNYGQRDRYNAEEVNGTNSRLDEIQAAILSVKLPHLGRWNDIRASLMKNYMHGLRELPIRFQKTTPGCVPAWHLAVLALESNEVRDKLESFLKRKEIGALIHYPKPTHMQKAFLSFSNGELPLTEALAGRILSIPFNIGLTEKEQNYVIEKISEFFKGS